MTCSAPFGMAGPGDTGDCCSSERRVALARVRRLPREVVVELKTEAAGLDSLFVAFWSLYKTNAPRSANGLSTPAKPPVKSKSLKACPLPFSRAAEEPRSRVDADRDLRRCLGAIAARWSCHHSSGPGMR